MASAEPSALRVDARRWDLSAISLTSAVIAIAAGCCAVALNNWLQREWLASVWLYKTPNGLLHMALAALTATLSAVVVAGSVLRGRAQVAAARALRWALIAIVVGWFCSWTIEEPRVRFDGQRIVVVTAACWSLLAAVGVRNSERGWPRWLARVELWLALAAASVLATELGLRAWRAASQPRLLATPSTDAASFVRAHRLVPGSIHCASLVNSEGYADDEPDGLSSGAPWIACVGDSFSVGVVPRHRHYTTLAERVLGVPVYNLGVVYAGPREYLHMVREDAMPRAPRLVVVALFLGNDTVDSRRRSPDWLESWTSSNESLLRIATMRLRAISTAGVIDKALIANAQALDPVEIERRLKWLADPMLERPTFEEHRFQYIEVGRARELLEGSPEMFEPMLEWLRLIRQAASPVPVGVLVLPDEFQVEDAVWQQVVEAGLPPDADRARPQRWLGEQLAREGFEYVDVLPMLLEVPPLADGRRHVYHLRDTHFNARGNEVAARALVELVRRYDLSR